MGYDNSPTLMGKKKIGLPLLLKAFLCIAVILSGLSGCVKDSIEANDSGNIGVGDLLPALELQLSDGSIIDNAGLQGKVSVIILFSVDCNDCKNELPVVEQFYSDFKGHEDFVLFGISREEGNEKVGLYWSENNLTFPYSPQKSRAVYNLFASSGVPRIYISDRARVVRAVFADQPVAGYEPLAEAVSRLLSDTGTVDE